MSLARRWLLRFLIVLMAVLLSAGTSLPVEGAGPSGAADSGKLTPALAGALANGRQKSFPVIVRFNRPLAAVDWAELEHISNGPVVATHRLSAIQAAAVTLPAGRVQALARSPQVEFIEEDSLLQLTLAGATQWFGADQARTGFGVDGAGITIAILDTGIDGAHADLAGKVVAWTDLIAGRAAPYDDHGHGTHVAGIAAGTGAADARYQGVAPGAALAGIKVCGADGMCSRSAAAAGLQWAIDNRAKYNIRVANLSFGSSTSSDGSDSLSAMVNAAAASGIVTVVSAGNAGPNASTIGSPAAARDAITVGMMADVSRSGFSPVRISSRGPTADGRIKPDIMAPGYLISAPRANTSTGYVAMTGTSMAAPFVAGVAAMLLQANPGLSPAQVKSTLLTTAIDWGPAGPDAEYGHGRLDAYAAVSAAAKSPGPGNLNLPAHVGHTGSLEGAGARMDYVLTVSDRNFPMAVTLIQPDWTTGATSFALELYDPAGNLISSRTAADRQDGLTKSLPGTGNYRLSVVSKAGAGRFYLDISAGMGQAAPPPAAPTVTIVAPADRAEVTGVLLLQATVDAPAGTGSLSWSAGLSYGGSMTLNATTGLWQATWDTAAVANGDYTLTVTARDTLGQTSSATTAVRVANAPPSSWSSGDLETRTWAVSGPGSAAKDYTYSPPGFPPVTGSITVGVSAYSSAGSDATDREAPYMELWAETASQSVRLSAIPVTGPGSYRVALTSPTHLAALQEGRLQVRLLSLDRKNGKQVDKLSIEVLTIDLQY